MALLTGGLAVGAACSSGGAKSTPTAAPPETPAASATAVSSPTPDIGPALPDGRRALAHVEKLSVDIGPRVAGTPSEIAARDYIKSTLESYGYDVSFQEFGFDSSAFRPARVDAGGAAIPAYAFRGSAGGSASGPLVSAGVGRPEDFPSGGLAGAAALVQRGDLTFSEKVGNAIRAGAGGVIIYNNEDGNFRGDLSNDVMIPVVSISKQDGESLATQAGVTATITVSQPQSTAYDVVARPSPGAPCVTITGGHYDSVPVTGGADDNASGAASVLETARVAAARHATAGNCFVLFSAEEFGLFGSKDYDAKMTDEDKQRLRGMVNLDVVGLPEPLTLIGSEDLVDTARIAANGLGANATVSTLPRGVGSDHQSFEDAGFPVVMLYRSDNQIHTPADAIGRIDAASLQETVAVALATLAAINPP